MSTKESVISQFSHEVAKATENEILKGLNSLIEQGLLVVHTGPFTMIREFEKVRCVQQVELKLRDQEIIDSLRKDLDKANTEVQYWKDATQRALGENK